MRDEMSRNATLPSLDGLRAVSIVLVIASHAEFVPVGNLGVRIFFVISGFLITYLLLVEQNRYGGIDLCAFYLRRALRILPVYFAFLAVLALLAHDRMGSCEWMALLTFTKNFGCEAHWIDGHLWSLSIEEQFYLIWPIALVALGRRALIYIAIMVLIAAPVARVLYYLTASPYRSYSPLTNMDALMYGCLLAMLIDSMPRLLDLALQAGTTARAVAIILIVVPSWFAIHARLGAITVPFGPSLEAAGAALLILSLVYRERGVLFRVLNLRLVARLGILSYSLYIWQQPFFSQEFTLPMVFRIAGALGISTISYYAVERPFMSLRRRLRRLHSRDCTNVDLTVQPPPAT